MKIYKIGLIASVLFFTGCENIDFDFDTGNVTPVVIDVNETDDNETVDENETEFGVLDKRESVETIAKEWYVRIVVEDTTNNMKTASAQLGQLETADVVTKHSLKAIAPFRPTYLDVVFVDPIGVDAGSYKTNFHASGTHAESWEFTIKSHDANATMILSWRGLYVVTPYIDEEDRERYNEYRSMSNPLLSYMTLLDVATNTEIDVLSNGAVNEYVFSMDGSTTRTFRWKVKDTSVVVSPSFTSFAREVSPKNTQTDNLKTLQIQALRNDAKARPDALKQKRLDSFDMTTPPTFEVLVK